MAAPFDEVRFPAAIGFGATGGPRHQTGIVTVGSGREERNRNWSAPLRPFDVGGTKTQGQLDALMAFFLARDGRHRGFRYFDWSDHSVAGQAIGTGDDAEDTFQLVKTYASGGQTRTRDLVKIIDGETVAARLGQLDLAVYLDGTPTAAYSLDADTGIIVFTSPPGAGVAITADVFFDVPARFDTDELRPRMIDRSETDGLIYDLGTVPIVEVRL